MKFASDGNGYGSGPTQTQETPVPEKTLNKIEAQATAIVIGMWLGLIIAVAVFLAFPLFILGGALVVAIGAFIITAAEAISKDVHRKVKHKLRKRAWERNRDGH